MAAVATRAKAIRFIAPALDPGFAISAHDKDGKLLGVAGFKTAQGALLGGELRDLAQVYGWFGALWRGILLSLLEREIEPGVLLMDGMFVAEDARGQGVGGMLLRAIKDTARAIGAQSVRLDVIDINPRARALYEREGFVAGPISHIGPLRYLFGFRTSTEMRLDLSAAG